jgi:Na+/H+-dicarboxylate symporter
MQEKKKESGIGKLIKSPLVIILAMVSGILTGLTNHDISVAISPLGTIYLDLLKMTIFPILITAIITSIGNLFTIKDVSRYLIRIVVVTVGSLFLISVLALSSGLIFNPGTDLSEDAQITLGKTLSQADQSGQSTISEYRGLFDFLQDLIPVNIFQAMGEGGSLQILFFCIVLGVAVGMLPDEKRSTILDLTDSLFHAFFGIISWIMYLLPFGLFCLIAGQVAQTGIEILYAMMKFVTVIYGFSIVMLIGSALVVAFTTKTNPFKATLALRESLLIAFGTQSTFASMPSAIEGLSEELGVDHKLVNLVIPLGAVIARYSMIITYTIAAVFAAQLYEIPLNMTDYGFIVLLSVLAAVAGAGTPGIVSLAMITIVFLPLGLPSAAIVVLLLAINPIIEPITTMANVYGNCAATALIASSVKDE